MGVPKSIYIFGHIYQVQLTATNELDPDNSDADIDFKTKVIRIDQSLPEEEQKQRLLHEYLHGVVHYVCLDAVISQQIEEIAVDSISKALCESTDITFVDPGFGVNTAHGRQ